MTAEEMLLNFYKAYAEWLDNEADEDDLFKRSEGLCSNLEKYLDNRGLDFTESSVVSKIMVDQFVAARLDPYYPFNDDLNDYHYDIESKSMHLNTARVQWVRDRVEGKPIVGLIPEMVNETIAPKE